MTANSALIRGGISGGGASGLELLWVAPTGTTAPTDAHTTMSSVSASWESMGYVSSDGATLGVDESSEDITAFGTAVPVRVINTGSKLTLQAVLLETNPTVLEVYNRLALGTITPDPDGDFTFGEGDVPVQRYALVMDVVDGTNLWRRYYPSVEVTDRTERQIQNGQAITYGVTFTAYPGSDGDAVKNYYRVPDLAGS